MSLQLSNRIIPAEIKQNNKKNQGKTNFFHYQSALLSSSSSKDKWTQISISPWQVSNFCGKLQSSSENHCYKNNAFPTPTLNSQHWPLPIRHCLPLTKKKKTRKKTIFLSSPVTHTDHGPRVKVVVDNWDVIRWPAGKKEEGNLWRAKKAQENRQVLRHH